MCNGKQCVDCTAANCTGTNYCNSSGVCTAQGIVGATCVAADNGADCQSGYCNAGTCAAVGSTGYTCTVASQESTIELGR